MTDWGPARKPPDRLRAAYVYPEPRATMGRRASRSILPTFSMGRSRLDHRVVTGRILKPLNARVESLQAELVRLEVEKNCIEASAAGHRADYERERERCDNVIAEALRMTKVAMSARETAARLEGELAARQRQDRPWWKRVVA